VRAGDDIGMEALVYGVLRADGNSGCIWLEDEQGSARHQLLLTGDYEVVFEDEPVTVRGTGRSSRR
jgi:hypothetical protein